MPPASAQEGDLAMNLVVSNLVVSVFFLEALYFALVCSSTVCILGAL